jgi:hypothetical protein
MKFNLTFLCRLALSTGVQGAASSSSVMPFLGHPRQDAIEMYLVSRGMNENWKFPIIKTKTPLPFLPTVFQTAILQRQLWLSRSLHITTALLVSSRSSSHNTYRLQCLILLLAGTPILNLPQRVLEPPQPLLLVRIQGTAQGPPTAIRVYSLTIVLDQ